MFVLKLCQIVDIFINDNVQVVGFIMRRNVGSCKGFRHDVGEVRVSQIGRGEGMVEEAES